MTEISKNKSKEGIQNWWAPHSGNEWWEKSIEEEFLKSSSENPVERQTNSPHEFVRLSKIEELINEKIPLKERLSQTESMIFTLEEANKKALDEILKCSVDENSLLFKNLAHLFDHHFSEGHNFGAE